MVEFSAKCPVNSLGSFAGNSEGLGLANGAFHPSRTSDRKKTLSYSTRLVPPSANGSPRRLRAQQLPVTLAVTLQAGPAVTICRTRPKAAPPIEGDKVEEVEEPPFRLDQGDTHLVRAPESPVPTHACAHTPARA